AIVAIGHASSKSVSRRCSAAPAQKSRVARTTSTPGGQKSSTSSRYVSPPAVIAATPSCSLPPGKKWYSDPYGASLAVRIALMPVAAYPLRLNSSVLARTRRSRVPPTSVLTSAMGSQDSRSIDLASGGVFDVQGRRAMDDPEEHRCVERGELRTGTEDVRGRRDAHLPGRQLMV